MDKKSKINRVKGIEIITDLLFTGKQRKEIVQEFTETYGISESAVDKWMKVARVKVEELRTEAEAQKKAAIKESTDEMVKRLNLTREALLTELAKIAFFNLKGAYTVDGGLKSIHDLPDEVAAAIAGVESYDEKEPESGMILGTTQKVKISSKIAAIETLNKMLGYNAPAKVANTDADGNDIEGQKQFSDLQVNKLSDAIRAIASK
jgi:phage terminase small subunit